MKTVATFLPAVLLCLSLAGCASLHGLFKSRETPPTAINNVAQPTLEQITSAVNRNSQAIQNFSTESASIHMPGVMIPLHARLTFERPKRLRIQGAVSSLGSQEFDFGSNDERFWLWLRKMGEMWYCRHDLYPVSPVRSAIPIDPNWIIEALGMTEFKPTDQHTGPNRTSDGNWEIISYCQTPSGQYIKRTVIDSKVGWVIRQELYTPQTELVAWTDASDLRFDRNSGVYYMKRVSIWCQGMEPSSKMTIDLGSPVFNSTTAFAPSMFMMPVHEGYQVIDLCSPELMQQRGVLMPPPAMPNVPEAGMRTVIR